MKFYAIFSVLLLLNIFIIPINLAELKHAKIRNVRDVNAPVGEIITVESSTKGLKDTERTEATEAVSDSSTPSPVLLPTIFYEGPSCAEIVHVGFQRGIPILRIKITGNCTSSGTDDEDDDELGDKGLSVRVVGSILG